MRFLTDRKRAQGLGSGRTGTEHHWKAMISSAVLVVLVPLFVFTFGAGLGGSYEEVLAYFGRPCPAIITALTAIVVILHCKGEADEAIIDYVHGTPGKLLLVAVQAFSYAMIVAVLFALVKLAL
ncbi:succinate dehydrogenase, hydrophobic membrane anchor protein [Pseudooceanicola nanhaiensis]|uniref:succinate dehydrogenase, hydrophobic membrane anchor protein n=1 Tax=Pseudooceanicola nanhaiensis TaxID=375761 RepID=UPI001CD38CC1|nr:succinate dehydrogenase, hydrophobic membrane anchor protein [Pseudooceanicola nanhaiensis]MCA0919135.1 succinate dehydrogenase, hydrophobic membrane anchor protein [Pseudooceanicola nanhaiensis]